MVDLTPNANGHATTRLLDLVPGRSGKAYQDWLDARGQSFRSGVTVATLDPFHGYKNAIDERLEDARAVLDAFHVVKLANQAVDDVRRRVQQDTLGHRGRKGDLLYGIRNILRAGHENLTQRQQARLDTAFAARLEHVEVELAYRCAQQVRAVYHQTTLTAGRALAQTVIDSLPGCPVPEIARLGRTLKQWASEFLGYFDTNRASNGGTEAINGLIELHRRIARGFRNRDTTASACSSSPADSTNHPTLSGEEPAKPGGSRAASAALDPPWCEVTEHLPNRRAPLLTEQRTA